MHIRAESFPKQRWAGDFLASGGALLSAAFRLMDWFRWEHGHRNPLYLMVKTCGGFPKIVGL
jgi:anti-sigma regulatory factor (Ser/Thr protein kinase)